MSKNRADKPTSKKLFRYITSWISPFVALFIISSISVFSYFAQLNDLNAEKEKTTAQVRDNAIEAIDNSYSTIEDIGIKATFVNFNSEQAQTLLDDFVKENLNASTQNSITFIAHIDNTDDLKVTHLSPGSQRNNVGEQFIGTSANDFLDLDKELEVASSTGQEQLTSIFRTTQLLENREIYTLVLFPIYPDSLVTKNNVTNIENTRGYIAIALSLDGFLENVQMNSKHFRLFRILDTDNNVIASSDRSLDIDDLNFEQSQVSLANKRLIFEYDNYSYAHTNDTSNIVDSLIINLAIGFVIFLIFSFLRYRENKIRKKADLAVQEIHETDARFSALIQKSTDITIVLNSKGKVIFASPSVTDQLEIENKELVGKNIFELVRSSLSRQKILRVLNRLNKGETVEPFEIDIETQSQKRKIFECAINDLRNDEAVRGIVCNSRDVTDKKIAELNEIKAKELYENALEHAPTGVALVNNDGSCFFCNDSLKEFLGQDGTSLINRRLREVIFEEDQFAFSELWSNLSTRGSDNVKSELRFSHPDGRHRWGLISIRAVYDDDLFQYYIVQIEDTTERKTIAERLEYQAIHDPLTGLPNRLLFVDRLDVALQRSKRTGLGVTVLFLDLDRFKIVNDSLGHAAGDKLLVAVAERIKSTVRPNDTVARFGGDEFVILCEDISDDKQTQEITNRLLSSINKPILLPDGEVYVTASIGIAKSLAGEDTPETILRDADTAMYRAKDDGRNRSAVFDERTHARAVANLETGNGMFRALEKDEFRVRYQPIVSLLTGRLTGFEALVYWEDPQKGHVSPNEFIALAEETGVIIPLGLKIFEKACKTLHRWHQMSSEASHLRMSINLSARQIAEPTLYDDVKKIIDKTGVDADKVWFEITESALMIDTESTISMLDQLRSLGVHFEVDDFGTGFSSLSYLKKFPLDALKIDQSFIDGLGTEPEDTAIVTAVVSLSHALGLQVIAEGVETPIQMAELKTLGCEYAQGYLFAYPDNEEKWDRVIMANELFEFSDHKPD